MKNSVQACRQYGRLCGVGVTKLMPLTGLTVTPALLYCTLYCVSVELKHQTSTATLIIAFYSPCTPRSIRLPTHLQHQHASKYGDQWAGLLSFLLHLRQSTTTIPSRPLRPSRFPQLRFTPLEHCIHETSLHRLARRNLEPDTNFIISAQRSADTPLQHPDAAHR